MQNENIIRWLTDPMRRASICTRRALLLLVSSVEVERIPDFEEEPTRDQILIRSVDSAVEHKLKTSTQYVLQRDTKHVYALNYLHGRQEMQYICLGPVGAAPLHIYEKFMLKSGMIENYDGPPIETTYGRYISNYLLLANPFGSMFPYINDVFKFSNIENNAAKLALQGKLTTNELSRYMDNAFFMSMLAEICVPIFSQRALTPNPEIAKRKAELLKKYEDELKTGDTAIAVKIEDELIEMDKQYLKGDPSDGFYSSAGKKYNVHRKSQYLALGLVEKFQQERGQYTFLETALIDGWKPEEFADICSNARQGSYRRGIETEQGGVQTKYLLRTLQNLELTEEDCGSKTTYTVLLTKENIEDHIGYYVTSGPKSNVYLDDTNKSEFIGSTVQLRTPMGCKTKNGYCYRCTGQIYKTLGVKEVGPRGLEIGAAFLTASLKAMHGIKLSSMDISDIDNYTL